MAEEQPLSKGETFSVVGLLIAVGYGLYELAIYAIHLTVNIAVKGWQVLKIAASGFALVLVASFTCAAALDASLLGIDRILRAWRVRRGLGGCAIPRYRSYTGEDTPSSWLDMFLGGLVSAALERSYGQGAVVDEAAFSAFVRRSLPGLVLRPENRSRIEARVVGPLYARVQQGDPALEAWLERYGKRRRRRPFFVVCRLAFIISRRQIGWSEAQSWKTPDPDRLKSEPELFNRFFFECGWSGVTAIEAMLKSELALKEGEWTPPRTVEPAVVDRTQEETRPGPWRRPVPLALPPASGINVAPEGASMDAGSGEHDREGLEEVPVSDEVLAEDAELVVGGVLAQLHTDGELWEAPVELLAEVSRDLLLAAIHHPTPGQVHELRSHVLGMQARLPAFAGWFGAQMAGPFESWSPIVLEAVSGLEEPYPALVERNVLRCFLHAGNGDGSDNGGKLGGGLEAGAAVSPASEQGTAVKKPAVIEVEARDPGSVEVLEAGTEAPAGKGRLSFLREAGASRDLASEVF